MRITQVKQMKADGDNPYPHKFHVEMSLSDYIEKYQHLEDGSRLEDVQVSIAGPYISCSYKIYNS